MVKSFNVTIDYVLYDMSYANVMLYSATLPDYDKRTDKNGKPVIDADDPKNKEVLRKILTGEIV